MLSVSSPLDQACPWLLGTAAKDLLSGEARVQRAVLSSVTRLKVFMVGRVGESR